MHRRAPERLAELDLLRFVAALAVVAFHYLVAFKSVWGEQPAELFPAVAPLAGLGILGVELFFMISGFVILMSAWGRGLGAFARSRFVRLYPAYWLSLAAAFGLYGVLALKGPDPKLTGAEYALNATMFQRLFKGIDAVGVYWSLWAELRFYLIMAVMILIGITANRILILGGVWLAAATGALFLDNQVVNEIVMPAYAPYFVAGMSLYLIHRRGSSWLPWLYVVAGWALALNAALERVERRVKAAGSAAMPVTDLGVILTVTAIFVVMALVALGLLRMRSNGLLTALGGTTYPLYLFHSAAAVVLIPLLAGGLPPWLIALVTLLAAILVSYLVYACVERPVQRLLRPRKSSRTPAAPSTQVEKASVP
ncbi:acyltransferase family protein [Nonomuraea sp. NPDC059007]|uniref:acyltransferase family protein n=1 Tax=Nonomuraea sp. NPDC059007 TaxID=3346692 RepID=UPI003687361D